MTTDERFGLVSQLRRAADHAQALLRIRASRTAERAQAQGGEDVQAACFQQLICDSPIIVCTGCLPSRKTVIEALGHRWNPNAIGVVSTCSS